MRRINAAILLALVSVLSCHAQENKSQLLQRINEIKSQSDIYYWDRFAHENADSAKVNATKRMLLDINVNRSDDEKISVESIMPFTKYIKVDRGTYVQFFAYIRKDEAAALIQSNGNAPRQQQEDIRVQSQPINTLPAKKFVPEAFVQNIVQTKMFQDVYRLLKSLQSQGQILQFGKLKDVEDYSSLDLILFDIQSQQVITLLSPVNSSGRRINLVNGADDALDNYPANMTAVIWYIRK